MPVGKSAEWTATPGQLAGTDHSPMVAAWALGDRFNEAEPVRGAGSVAATNARNSRIARASRTLRKCMLCQRSLWRDRAGLGSIATLLRHVNGARLPYAHYDAPPPTAASVGHENGFRDTFVGVGGKGGKG